MRHKYSSEGNLSERWISSSLKDIKEKEIELKWEKCFSHKRTMRRAPHKKSIDMQIRVILLLCAITSERERIFMNVMYGGARRTL